MRHQIALLQHVDPDLAFIDQLIGKGLLDRLAGQIGFNAVVAEFIGLDQGYADQLAQRMSAVVRAGP